MPLNWLCSEANLPEGCSPGKTCVAGACEDRTIANPSELAGYEEVEATSCFDTAGCFESITFPSVPKGSGQCGVSTAQAGSAVPNVNVALIVNTAAVGNYGVCGLRDQCRIPLARGGSEGWKPLMVNGESMGIGLPAEVCNQVGATVEGVEIADTSTNDNCPVKSDNSPLCAAESTCLGADVCPPEWPSSWKGYSCSAAQSPKAGESAERCWAAGQEREPGPAPGLWCCTGGQSARANDDPLLIDDMTLGPQVRVVSADGSVAGFWWTDSDDPNASLLPGPSPPKLFTYREIEPPIVPEDGPTIDRAACLKSEGFNGYVAMLGFYFAEDLEKGSLAPFDVSAYTGVTFWAHTRPNDEWDGELELHFTDQNTDVDVPDSTCNLHPEGGQCGDNWAKRGLTFTETWTRYHVAWDELEQEPDSSWGAKFELFDREHVYAAHFTVRGYGPDWPAPPFDFCVAHVYFTE
jgi:hypothetical protein